MRYINPRFTYLLTYLLHNWMTLEDDVLLYGVYMVLMDSRSGTYDITDDVMT